MPFTRQKIRSRSSTFSRIEYSRLHVTNDRIRACNFPRPILDQFLGILVAILEAVLADLIESVVSSTMHT